MPAEEADYEEGAAMRYAIRIPDGKGYMLGDCTVGGQKVRYGGQLVKNAITCYLRVATYRAPITPLPTRLPPPAEAAGTVAAPVPAAAAVGVPVEAAAADEEQVQLALMEVLDAHAVEKATAEEISARRRGRWWRRLIGC